jgi:hypothetical protein
MHAERVFDARRLGKKEERLAASIVLLIRGCCLEHEIRNGSHAADLTNFTALTQDP